MSHNRDLKPLNLKSLFALALPMVISQASETIMMFADRLFLSSLGRTHIAASMSGGLTTFVFFSFFTGTVGYVNAIIAQYYGAGSKNRCVETLSQGLYLSLLFYPFMLLLIYPVRYFFILAGHTQTQVALEYTYFAILMSASILAVFRSSLVGYFLGTGKTGIVMKANVTGMIINIPLNYILIFGKLGFPALGIRGAAYGTIGGSLAITLILFLAFLKEKYYREYDGTGVWKIRPDLIKRILHFGLPAGVEIFLNVFAFNIYLQLMHSYSEDVAAAVTIAFNWDMVAFIPMLGMGFATTALVGQQKGAGSISGARKAVSLSLWVSSVYALAMMMAFIFGADTLVGFFTRGLSASESAGITPLARSMVRLAAVYTLADISQLIFAGALRGAGDTKWVMYTLVSLHWVLALCSWLFIKVLHLPPIQVWIFFICFVIVQGLFLYARYRGGKWEHIQVIEES